MISYKNNSITVFESAIFKMNSTVVSMEDLILVVDPGYLPHEIKEIRQYVDKMKRDKPIFLFFTHSDFDHIVGYGAFPNAKTVASRQFVESRLKDKQVIDIINFDDDLYIDRCCPIEYPKIDYMIKADGQSLTIGESCITFFHASGHTDDGLLAEIEIDNHILVIAGDYLSNLEFPFIYHSFSEYRKTLSKLKKITQNRRDLTLIPGHGSVATDVIEIQQRIKDSDDYFFLLKNNHTEDEFNRFVAEKNYKYLSNLTKRHQENLALWRDVT